MQQGSTANRLAVRGTVAQRRNLASVTWLVAACTAMVACRSHPAPAPKAVSDDAARYQLSDPWAITQTAGADIGPGSAAPPAVAAANASASSTVEVDPTPLPTFADNHARVASLCPAVTKPYFYQVQKAGKTGYILGTRHISIGLGKLPAFVQRRLENAPWLVFETPPGDHSDRQKSAAETSGQAIGAARWPKFEALVGQSNATRLRTKSTEEAMLWMMVMFEDPTQLLDIEIQQLAATRGIKTSGLETSAFQAKLLGDLLNGRALRATLDATDGRAELLAESDRDIKTFCQGQDKAPGLDAKAKADLAAGGYTPAEIAEFDEVLLYRRNEAWLPQLETLFSNQGLVVVVGGDHLPGPRGVLAGLAKRGFAIKRVTE